jgi:DNA repair exonuclease SbcCD nuclease subunit
MARYLACSDLHLGAGADLGLEPGDRLREQAAVWQRIVFEAAERGCDALLFAGDAFHRNKPTPQELLAFADPLVECTIPVFAINGNSHDFVGVGQAMAVDVVDALSASFELHTEPDVILLPGGVALAVLPWAPVSRVVAMRDGGDRDDVNVYAAELLLEVARGLAEQCATDHPGKPAMLMTHFSISGASLPSGLPIDMAREPILPATDLALLGFDCVIAGHIHRAQALDPDSFGFYCGSPMPLSFGEPGEHGFWIVDVSPAGAVEFTSVPLSSRPFITIDVEAEAVLWAQDEDDCHDAVEHLVGIDDLTDAFVKLRYSATEDEARRIDQGKVRQSIEEAGAYRVWIEQTVERAHRERGSVIDDAGTRVDQLAAYLDAIGTNGDVAPAMLERASTYLEGSTT